MEDQICVRGAKEHNLKNISIDIPRNKMVVITGLSGSGKSSLAFDTIYAEGQRRYVESLSAYARQFLEMQNKPDVESITGLSPAIAIDQRTTSRNPRSTVSTVTEIYDYLRLLYARIGVPYSPATGKPINSQTVSEMVDAIQAMPEGAKILLLAPIVRGRKGEYQKEISALRKQGFSRLRIDGTVYEMAALPALDKNKKHDIEVVVDRLVMKPELGQRLVDSIETALRLSEGLLYAYVVDAPAAEEGKSSLTKGERITFSERYACPESGFTLTEIEPRLFSFNSPYGACTECDGLGTAVAFSLESIVPDQSKSLSAGAISPWSKGNNKFMEQALQSLARHYNFSLEVPFQELSEDIKEILLNGSGEEEIAIAYDDGIKRFNVKKPFEGVIPNLLRRLNESDGNWMQEELAQYQLISHCPACKGFRLKPEALCVKIANQHIGEVCTLTISKALQWFKNLPNDLNETQKKIGERALKEVVRRLEFLHNVGLDYLTLRRESGTLSGGESQRIRLASQIGSGLSGVLYVLDEPSIGLHQSDNQKLIETLKGLRDLGNTVLVVEHDEDTMRQADHLIDIGPGAGIHGGQVMAQGTPAEVAEDPNSITGQYLSGRKFIPVPQTRRQWFEKRSIRLQNVTTNNLRGIDAIIPLGAFTCVTGVSGGGKSSLVIHTLYKALSRQLNGSSEKPGPYESLQGLHMIDKIIDIDQSPIGRTPRSNPATYTGAFGPIRDWFTALPEAKARGYKPGRFSFNVKGGRCEACQGDGVLKIEMHFLPDVYVQCEQCKGKRYNRETLEIRYRDVSISDVLEMTAESALEFFSAVPTIRDKLAALVEVGLGYVRLGQSATTLSGGEAQRVKLAKELSRHATGRTFYILDEPTTGLHADDIGKLLRVLHQLVDSGNTIVVIEHNLDVIKTADYIIDIGPGGGEHGGYVVATGTPEEVAVCKESITGKYLAPYLNLPKAESKKTKRTKA